MATCLTNPVVFFLLSVQTSFVHTSSQESRRAVDIHDLPDLLGRLISRRFPPLQPWDQAGGAVSWPLRSLRDGVIKGCG